MIMVKMKHILKSLIFLAVLAQFNYSKAQTKAEVVDAYNKGVEMLKTDTLAAIKAFEDCIAVCDKVGAEGDSIKTVVSKLIPLLSFDLASGLAKAKNYEAATSRYLETIKLAGKYGDDATVEKSKNNLPQLYYAIGAAAYSAKDYSKATENLNKALEYDPNMANVYYVLAVIQRSQKNYSKLEEYIDKAVGVSKASNDQSTEKKAISLGKATFYNSFVNLSKANKISEAIDHLKIAIKYAPDEKDYIYYLGSAYNKVKNYDEAIANLNKAMEMDSTASPEDKAKYYFEIATALAAKGDTNKACEAYKNAQYGKYAENAKYQITTVLKCK